MAESSGLKLADPAATARFGGAVAKAIAQVRPERLIVYLEGELGAGKTALTRAVLAGLGHHGRVPSPTYTLVEPYTLGEFRVLHVDLYRLRDPAELDYLGLGDELGPGSLLFVEWPTRSVGRLPPADLTVALSLEGSGRRVELRAHTSVGIRLDRAIDRDALTRT